MRFGKTADQSPNRNVMCQVYHEYSVLNCSPYPHSSSAVSDKYSGSKV